MEHLITPDIKRILLIFGVGFAGLSFVTGLIISKIKGAFKPFARKTILYLLIYSIGFAVVAMAINISTGSKFVLFIIFQILFLCLGIIHVNTLPKYNKWSTDDSFWLNLLFSFAIVLGGAICFIIAYRYFDKDGLDIFMTTSGLFFLVPLFVRETFLKAIAIPPKIYKLWYYPVHQKVEPIPDESKLKNLLIISFEFKKQESDEYYTNFRAKAPVDMDSGELFYYFVNDYNIKHPQGKIEYINKKSGQPYGWIFYKKPKWYTIVTRYINMDKTIFINNIHENDIIVCSRQNM